MLSEEYEETEQYSQTNQRPKTDFACDECWKNVDTLYQGYFRHSQSLNPWAKGTATAGLLQLKRVCKVCLEEYERLGLRPGGKSDN